MGTSFTIHYSKYVLTATDKNKINNEIVKAVESSKEIKREMDRVFQVANRRIQNLEKNGTPSPALMSLGDMGDRYTKFTRSGKSFTEQKREYLKAINFLQQPTSTATGAKQFNKHLKTIADVPDELWEEIQPELVNGFTKFESGLMGAMRYEQVMEAYYNKTVQVLRADREDDVRRGESNYNRRIKELQNQGAKKVENAINNGIRQFAESIGKIFE